MNTLKDMAATAKTVTQVALRISLVELKNYIDTHDNAIAEQLNALIGAAGGDADKILNTFNEIKTFLADYTEDDTLKSLLDAVNNAVSAEQTRAEAAEQALDDRLTVIENIHIMTEEEAEAIFDEIFNP